MTILHSFVQPPVFLTEFYVPQTDRTWYLTETETLDLPDYRTEFRIDLSFPLTIVPQGTS